MEFYASIENILVLQVDIYKLISVYATETRMGIYIVNNEHYATKSKAGIMLVQQCALC